MSGTDQRLVGPGREAVVPQRSLPAARRCQRSGRRRPERRQKDHLLSNRLRACRMSDQLLRGWRRRPCSWSRRRASFADGRCLCLDSRCSPPREEREQPSNRTCLEADACSAAVRQVPPSARRRRPLAGGWATGVSRSCSSSPTVIRTWVLDVMELFVSFDQYERPTSTSQAVLAIRKIRRP